MNDATKNLAMKCVVGLAIVIRPVAFAHAETNQIGLLDLDSAVTMAERLHPELAEADAMIEAAKGRAIQAGTFPNPEGIARAESLSGDGVSAEYLAGVSQPLPLGGKRSKARKAEELEVSLLGHEREAKRIELQRRVHTAFATALYQEEAFRAEEILAGDAAKLAAIVKARVDAGDATTQDLARAELDAERAKLGLQRANSLRDQAVTALAGTIGSPSLVIHSLAGNLSSVWELPALEELVKDLRNHPALLASDKAIDRQRARVDLSKAERVPDVRVELLYRRLENENRSAVDVGFSVPLPLFDRNRGSIRQARAELLAAEARARARENDLNYRLRAAYAALASALSAGRAFESNIAPRAEAVFKSAQERYVLGDISLSELLALRREWNSTKLTALELSRYTMQAWSDLRAVAGRQ